MSMLPALLRKTRQATNFLKILRVSDSWKQLQKTDVLFVQHEHDRSIVLDGKYYSPLCGSVQYYLEQRGLRCANLSKQYQTTSCKQAYYLDKTTNRIFIAAWLVKTLRALTLSLDPQNGRQEIDTLVWLRILRHARPKCLIAIQPDDGLCHACHILSIPVYDLQHGVISETNHFYGQYYKEKIDKKWLPTGFLCWDYESADVLNRWCAKKQIAVIVLGNPWLYRFAKPKQSDFILSLLSPPPLVDTKKKCILVSLQWGLDDFYRNFFASDEFIHPAVLNAIDMQGADVNWLLRLHPVQLKKPELVEKLKLQVADKPNVYIDWPTQSPLPLVLLHSHVHITWDSSVVIESALFGIKSYVLNPGQFSNKLVEKPAGEASSFFYELPYLKQENDGMVTRAKEFPDTEALLAWLSETQTWMKCNQTPIFFDEDKLYEIARG